MIHVMASYQVGRQSDNGVKVICLLLTAAWRTIRRHHEEKKTRGLEREFMPCAGDHAVAYCLRGSETPPIRVR